MATMNSDFLVEQANRGSERFGDNLFNALRYKNERARLRPKEQLDQATSMAALQESGFNFDPETNTLTRDPGVLSLKQLQAKKTQLETDRLASEIENQKKWSGMYGSTSGATADSAQPVDKFGPQPEAFGAAKETFGGGQTSNEMYIMIPDPTTGRMKMVPNPAFQKPMHPLTQQLTEERLRVLRGKASEQQSLEANKETDLRKRAESMLSTIEEVRKGKDYFGPAGNLPSHVTALPGLFGGYEGYKEEYGPRRNWEANIQKLLGQKIVDLMAEMKAQSRTGATGFGQLNRSELQLLREASTALSRDLVPEDAMRYLNQIEELYSKVLNKSGEHNRGMGIPEFASEQEAQASGYKGDVIIAGRPAEIR